MNKVIYKYVFAIAAVCTCFMGYGQAREDTVKKMDNPVYGPSGYIGVSAGFAIPIGGYNAKEFDIYPPPGVSIGPLVTSGYGISISGAKPIGQSSFGVGGELGYYSNSFSINNYVNALNRVDIGQFTPQSATGYKVFSLMAGPAAMLPFNKLSVDITVLAGALYVISPDIRYYGTNVALAPVVWEGNWYVQSLSFITPALNFGIHARYRVQKRLSFLLGGNLLFSARKTVNFVSNAQPYLISNLIIVNLLNVNAGIAYRI